MLSRLWKNAANRVFILLSAVTVCGCGLTADQKSALTEFGTSTSSYADTVGTIASQTQDNVDLMRERSLELPTTESDKDFQKVRVSGLADYISNQKAREHIALVEGLASSLKSYGQVLVEFSNFGDPAARSKTIVDIANQLDNVLRTPVAQAQATAIGQAVAFVTNQIVEAAKKHDIKAIVTAYQPGVTAAANLIGSEFQGKEVGTLFFEYKVAIALFKNRIPDIQTTRIGSGFTLVAAQGRQAIVENEKLSADQQVRYQTLQKQGEEASAALVKANDAVVAAMNDDTLSTADISDFVTQVEALYQAFKSSK